MIIIIVNRSVSCYQSNTYAMPRSEVKPGITGHMEISMPDLSLTVSVKLWGTWPYIVATSQGVGDRIYRLKHIEGENSIITPLIKSWYTKEYNHRVRLKMK